MALLQRASQLLARIGGTRRSRRSEPRARLRTFRAALIHGEDVRWPAVIRDFSRYGMRLETSARLRPGEHVVIDVAGHGSIAGVVRWSNSRTTGIRLTRSLPKEWAAPLA